MSKNSVNGDDPTADDLAIGADLDPATVAEPLEIEQDESSREQQTVERSKVATAAAILASMFVQHAGESPQRVEGAEKKGDGKAVTGKVVADAKIGGRVNKDKRTGKTYTLESPEIQAVLKKVNNRGKGLKDGIEDPEAYVAWCNWCEPPRPGESEAEQNARESKIERIWDKPRFVQGPKGEKEFILFTHDDFNTVEVGEDGKKHVVKESYFLVVRRADDKGGLPGGGTYILAKMGSNKGVALKYGERAVMVTQARASKNN